MIRKQALALGFDDCCFTTAAAPESAEHFRQWLREERHGEMGYLQRNAHKRVNPQLVLPGAETIITLASSYGEADATKNRSSHSKPVSKPSRAGVVARYARHTDYHDVLAEQLRNLTDFISRTASGKVRSLWYVDTGPLLERDLAQRAGLGFIGKHTNLISRAVGNWFFISEIITTLALEPDEPERNHCGTCTKCIAACPTGALTQPFQLDARRCISYLTIELKGAIPVELRSYIGNRIYGCDDCLAACPWNRFARAGSLMKQHARPELEHLDLIELLALDDYGFRTRFAGTAIVRLKRRGLLRNVCVALGNVGTRYALPALERASTDPEPLVAEHALWAIEQIRNREAVGLTQNPTE